MAVPQTPWRCPRVALDAAPAILRSPDGRQQRGKLEILSLSGGLLNMATTVQQGSQLKLLFVTHSGPVLSAVEMLPPVSTERQPFRFVSIEKSDQGRLRAAVQSLTEPVQDAWIEKYRSAMNARNAKKRGFFRVLLRTLHLL